MSQNPQPAEVSNKRIAIELEQVKAEHASLKVKYDALEKAHRELVDVVDGQNRATLAKQLMDLTKLTVEDIEKIATPDMMSLVESYKLLKRPFVSVKPAADEDEQPSNVTVGSRFKFARK